MMEIETAFTQPRKIDCEVVKKNIECNEILSIEEVCNWLGVSERTIHRYIEEHNFPCKKIGKTRLFGKRAIIDWVNKSD